ncbi:transposase [Alicyclobacillus acidoterrestris]|uniref:transposase n=1 Tax=Alicyclobacillus acidoterrestris TaxID=1450 RepID=UPI003F52B039
MKGALRHKSAKLLQSLNGRLRRHHVDMLRFSYEHLQFIEEAILEVEQEIRAHIADKQEAFELITTVPGINENAAAIILAEIGTDMEQFGGDKQLAAWAELGPGNHESAGKKTGSVSKWEEQLILQPSNSQGKVVKVESSP